MMMKISKKWFAVFGMLIFIGISVAPRINAENVTEKYLIEFMGTDKSYIVSSEQLMQIDALIVNYHQASDTDKGIIGLLSDIRDIGVISDDDFLRFSRYHQLLQELNSRFDNRIIPPHHPDSHQNSMCSVVASMNGYGSISEYSFPYGFITSIPPLGVLFYLVPFLYYIRGSYYHFFNGLIPLQLLGMVYLGYDWYGYTYAKGIINTSGVHGDITSEGKFLGNFPLKKLIWTDYGFEVYTHYIAMIGYIGLKIPIIEIDDNNIIINGHHLIGFALHTHFELK